MKKARKEQDIILEEIFLAVSEDLTNKQARGVICDALCGIVKDSITEAKTYEATGRVLDTTIGVVLGLNHHEAIIELRKRAYHKNFDCDYSLQCQYFPRSAHLCYTKSYTRCPGYRNPTVPILSSPIGKTFHSS